MSQLTVAVAGQAGAGKTSLLRLLKSTLEHRGVDATIDTMANTQNMEIVVVTLADPQQLARFAAEPFPSTGS